MPLYEYKCHSCGKTFEALQKFSDEPLKTHEGCGGELERLMSAPAFHLKGTGWYATDYGKGNAGTKPTESKAEAGDKAEKKSEKEKKDSASSSTETKSTTTESKPAPAPAADSK